MNKLERAKLSLEISLGNIEDSAETRAVKTINEAYEKAMEAVTSVVNQIFLLDSNLLSDEAKNSPGMISCLNKLTAVHGWSCREKMNRP